MWPAKNFQGTTSTTTSRTPVDRGVLQIVLLGAVCAAGGWIKQAYGRNKVKVAFGALRLIGLKTESYEQGACTACTGSGVPPSVRAAPTHLISLSCTLENFKFNSYN